MQGSLSVVIPVYNEAAVIEDVVNSAYREIIKKHGNAELIVAEDGSTDGTKEILKKFLRVPDISVFTGDDKKGYFNALKGALQIPQTDFIFYMDSDGTLDPREFWKLQDAIGSCDIVAGVRKNRDDPFYRKVLSSVYNAMVRFMFGLPLSDSNSGFKLFRRESVATILPEIKHIPYGFSTEFLARAKRKGLNISAVEIMQSKRKAGKAEDFQLRKIPKVVYRQLDGMLKLKMELLRS
ncbi:MAG TPA: glycosyltransferase family 2 protein [archaeon]|nr:glycosyltransferase family 2 protein [archaeon]